ncbi:MAG: HD domain-containing protein [Desulfotomaculum sp.]|nr:HD domain-containing protein [Desulfotomaculum sp.]
MFYTRIKQFFSAINSTINSKDQHFILLYLNLKEQKLFFDMDVPTQKHCLNVAYTCWELLQNHPKINKEVLLKAALLHDCGKKAGEVTTLHRVAIVLSQAFMPNFAKKMIQQGQTKSAGTLSNAFYIQSIHSNRGAKIAKKAQVPASIITLIEQHHDHLNKNAPMELILLQQADNAN